MISGWHRSQFQCAAIARISRCDGPVWIDR